MLKTNNIRGMENIVSLLDAMDFRKSHLITKMNVIARLQRHDCTLNNNLCVVVLVVIK